MINLSDIQFFELRKPRYRKVKLSHIYRTKLIKAETFVRKERKIKEIAARIDKALKTA